MSTDFSAVCDDCRCEHHLGQHMGGRCSFGWGTGDVAGAAACAWFLYEHLGHRVRVVDADSVPGGYSEAQTHVVRPKGEVVAENIPEPIAAASLDVVYTVPARQSPLTFGVMENGVIVARFDTEAQRDLFVNAGKAVADMKERCAVVAETWVDPEHREFRPAAVGCRAAFNEGLECSASGGIAKAIRALE